MSDEKLQRLVSKLAGQLAAQAVEEYENEVYDMGVESPIEELMVAALSFALRSRDHHGSGEFGRNWFFHAGLPGSFETLNPKRDWRGFEIHCQFPIGKYQADFFVDLVHWRGQRIFAVIECDGHDYHERTKEQARHDKERDRYFQSLGLLVLRYTGSEIYKDALKCAVSALEIIEQRAEALAKAGAE